MIPRDTMATTPRVRPVLLATAALACLPLACRTLESAPRPARDEPAATVTPAGPCGSVDPALASVLAGTDILVLGEIHGTREIPAYALEAVCAALSRGHPTVLGLEIPRDEQRAVDRFLHSAGSADDRERLVKSSFWEICSIDGRATRAVLDLIDASRELIAAGMPLSVLCIDAGIDDTGTRDERMAGHALAGFSSGSKLVILVGSVHARTHQEDGYPVPMAHLLAREEPRVLTLRVRHAGGESWCTRGEPGVHAWPAEGAPDAHGPEVSPRPDGRGFGGVFDVGAITASEPARPDAWERVWRQAARIEQPGDAP